MQYGDIRNIDTEVLKPVTEQLFYRACLLLVQACICDDEAAGKIAEASATKTDLAYDFDVNRSGQVDINDAQLVYGMYNAKYENFDSVSMRKFLEADVTADGTVTVEDAAAVVNSFIK